MLINQLKSAVIAAILVCATGAAYAAGPGDGKTVRPAEGTNLEEKFQHQICTAPWANSAIKSPSRARRPTS